MYGVSTFIRGGWGMNIYIYIYIFFFLFIEYIWKDTLETSDTDSPGEGN